MTTDLTISRKQRLLTLEKEISAGLENFFEAGIKLRAIKDDELYKEAGFETWEKYCKERWDWSVSHVRNVILTAEYRMELPDATNSSTMRQKSWNQKQVEQLTRIPSKKHAATVALRVLKHVEKSGKRLTAAVVKKFVDQDLGIEKKQKPEAAPKDQRDTLKPYLDETLATIQGTMNAIQAMPGDVWKDYATNHEPGLVKRLAAACEAMALFLRK